MSSARILKRTPIHSGRVFAFERQQVLLPNGAETNLEIILHPGAAAILPLTGDGEILLLRQYRHAAGGEIWEIPAGTRETDEEPLVCAQRELREEAGVRAAEFLDLGVCLPLAAYSNERIHLFLARGLSAATQSLDVDEVISAIVALPVAKVAAMILSGEILDAKTIIAFTRAQLAGELPAISGLSESG